MKDLELMDSDELIESVKSACINLRKYRKAFEKHKTYSDAYQVQATERDMDSFSNELRKRFVMSDGGVAVEPDRFSMENILARSKARQEARVTS